MSELINLSYKERSQLEQLLKSRASGRIVRRVQALLLLEEGEPVGEIAELLRVSRQTIYNWATQFARRRALPVAERVSDGVRKRAPGDRGRDH